MNYVPFQEENPPQNLDNAPFSRVFVNDNKVEIKPFYDKIGNRYISPNPATTQTNMLISRAFLKGFQRDEFVISLIQNKITYSDFDLLIDKFDSHCGSFRMLKMFFGLMMVFILSGLTFIMIYIFDQYQNGQDNNDLLLSFGLGIFIGGGFGFFIIMLIVLKYYEYVIRRELILENQKMIRKGLYWNISTLAQHLILEIKP